MKRLLSLILALLFCLSVIVSCEKEEAPSTSEPSSSSGIAAPKSMIDEPYASYRIQTVSEELENNLVDDETSENFKFKGVTFDDFNEFNSFRKEFFANTAEDSSIIFEINESDFEGNIVYALLLRDGDNEPFKYGNIVNDTTTDINDERISYIMLAERDLKLNPEETSTVKLDIILVPKDELVMSKEVEKIDLLICSHIYLNDEGTESFVETTPQYITSSLYFRTKQELNVSPRPELHIYESYNVQSKTIIGAYSSHTLMVINDYEQFQDFLTSYIDVSNAIPITEDTFSSNFVLAVFRVGDIRKTAPYRYCDFQKTAENKYKLCLEFNTYSKVYDDNVPPPSYDLVVIPRQKCETSPADIEIYITRVQVANYTPLEIFE